MCVAWWQVVGVVAQARVQVWLCVRQAGGGGGRKPSTWCGGSPNIQLCKNGKVKCTQQCVCAVYNAKCNESLNFNKNMVVKW